MSKKKLEFHTMRTYLLSYDGFYLLSRTKLVTNVYIGTNDIFRSHFMPTFDDYLMRHGEYGVQDLVERLERYEGIVANTNLPLEQRWGMVMNAPEAVVPALAA